MALHNFGHNQPSFDDIVEENLRRGLLLTQRDTLIRCIEDPRLEPRHRMILAKVIKRTNSDTGTAFPGRKRLAEDTGRLPGDIPDPSGPYSEKVVSNTISDLIAFGYLVHDKRAATGGGRALSHYALAAPSVEDIELEINSYLQAIEAKAPRPRPDVTIRSDIRIADVTPRSDVMTEGDHSLSGPSNQRQVIDKLSTNPVVTTGSDVTTDVGTVTSSKKDTNTAGEEAFASAAARKRAAKPRTRLPKDWKPAPETIIWARENFVASDHQIAAEAEKFYAHHFGKGSTMADWPAAWRTWWFNGYHKIPRRTRPATAPAVNDDEMANAFERARMADEEARCRR